MSWTSWVKNFLKTGKVNGYEQAKNLLLGEGKEEEIASFLDFLPREEQEKLFTECWTQLSEPKKRILVNSIYRNDWQALTKDYDELTELEQIKRLELLGYISVPDVIDFLLEKMKSKKEAIRLSACGALKKQEPELILEPILKALTQPDEWLPSRVF
ncbi:MAG: HEAT repeat domain-containing protein [Clostridia bacterium]|nr:HEAT repeat domain-containing protein [Clostridia bacterium]